ncbi:MULTISPECIES: hypothetical protein [Micromonospora]|uniref:DUF916 domain-containing protein n=1 Tax=Micromonospora yangpuensis TaxID=683228 RepID=A0A1C6UID2_9ACTN|nr:hypothetical protein [Micromonospora yangpuensis]GGM03575.1 hypothetical protein GCM10012279_21620 [Micromonospora yangpuensis]SCL53649.1 hypothetical protein GA0070617_2429 [Micromonospora yangpuensis]
MIPAKQSRWRTPLVSLVVLLFLAVTGVPVAAEGDRDTGDKQGKSDGSIGIQLLEASADRHDDPRAKVYIVDHMKPGTEMTRRFAVTNTSPRPQRITMSVGTAEIRDNKFVPSTDPQVNELPEWVRIDQPAFVAPPHSTTTLRATVKIPPSAPRGERYGVIWASVASAAPDPEHGNVQKINRTGIRLYLDVGPGGDPPSDFEIDKLVPGRTEEGLPIVRATVRNTGERALDLSGRLWLSDGPGGLSAGPFGVTVGTTVAPGGTAHAEVRLDRQLPNGPWQARLRLESGRIHREFTGEITFPDENGSWGLPATLSDRLPVLVALLGALTLAAGMWLVVAVRRARSRVDRFAV